MRAAFCTASLIALLTCLTACSINPFAHDRQMTGSATGTLVGAGVGAATSAAIFDNTSAALLGGLAGGAIGYYVTSLNFDAGGVTHTGGRVFTQGDYVIINIPSDRLFDDNSADLLPSAIPVLKSALRVINRYPNDNIVIAGHASGFGTDRANRTLSKQRAHAVYTFFWNAGIDRFKENMLATRRMRYVGYGDRNPIANYQGGAASIVENSHIEIIGHPSRTDLQPTRTQNDFSNVGGLGEAHNPYKPTNWKDEHVITQAKPVDVKDEQHRIEETVSTTKERTGELSHEPPRYK